MKYVVLAFLCSVAVIAYIQRLGIQTAYEPIQRDLDIDTEQFGFLGAAWLLGYAAMQVPSGWLADRWGSRNALILYVILWSILTGMLGLCRDYPTILVLWFTMGMALAGAFPCAARAIAAWFPDTEKAMASGFLASSMAFGIAAASLSTSTLLQDYQLSWQTIYGLYGGLGLVWAFLFWIAVPARTQQATSNLPLTRADWHRLFTSVPMWLLCGQQFFRAGAMIFFMNWFPKFLREARNLPREEANEYTFYANLAAMVGGILGGLFSDWLFRRTGLRRLSRQGIAFVGMTGAGALILVAYFSADDGQALILFSLGACIATFGGVSGYTVAIEFGGRRVALVFSIMNMCGNFGAALFAYLAGAIVRRTASWDFALYLFAAVFAIDAICWALLDPRGPLFPREEEASPPP